MPRLPDPADLDALRAFDTPTICNALELVAPARRATASPAGRWSPRFRA